MAKIEDGASGAILAGVDAASRTLRVSPRPPDALGHYRYAGATGILTGAAAFSELMQFRWADAASLALVQFIRVRMVMTAGFTVPQELTLELLGASAYAASGAGGTQVLPSATNLKKRASFPQSRLGDLRLASTAVLTAGSRQLSSACLMTQSAWAAGTGPFIDMTLDLTSSAAEYPLALAQNEGLALRLGSTAMGAGGSARVTVEMAWAEMAAGGF